MTTQWKTAYSTTEVERVNCPLCGSPSSTELAQEWTLGIVRCSTCDLIYVNPRLKEPEKNYWTTPEKFLQKYRAVFDGTQPHNRDRNYREHLQAIRSFQPKGRFLDIGTHCGFFLRLARGEDWQLNGVEPSASAATLASEKFGLNVHPGYLERGLFPPDYFDVVSLTDVLEHVTQPLELLTIATEMLKPGGVLFVKVPNATWNSLKYRLLKQTLKFNNYDGYNAREHVVHYTQETLTKMLEKAGLVPQKIYIPLPIQEGKWWQKSARSIAYHLAQLTFKLTGKISPLSTDIACIAKKIQKT